VAIGAWASKFCTGSILPLVETRLRMGPRSTVVARTGTGPRRETKTINAITATPSSSQTQRAREAAFELFVVVANLVSFQDAAGITVSINLPLRLVSYEYKRRSLCHVRCWI
jgi:hypothetical protein